MKKITTLCAFGLLVCANGFAAEHSANRKPASLDPACQTLLETKAEAVSKALGYVGSTYQQLRFPTDSNPNATVINVYIGTGLNNSDTYDYYTFTLKSGNSPNAPSGCSIVSIMVNPAT